MTIETKIEFAKQLLELRREYLTATRDDLYSENDHACQLSRIEEGRVERVRACAEAEKAFDAAVVDFRSAKDHLDQLEREACGDVD